MSMPLLTETRRALSRLAEATQLIGRMAGDPELFGQTNRMWWRYPEEGPLQVIAVKSARAVSGLNACVHLLHAGHYTEIAVLLRTVDDFLDEITFILEAHHSESPTSAQHSFLEHFFSEDISTTQELLEDQRGPDRTRRKSIQAAQGRYIEPDNPDRIRHMAGAIDSVWNGYVHGAYPHSMELFDPGNRMWILEGSTKAPYVESVRRQHAFYVSRALNELADVCYKVGKSGLAEALLSARKKFESSNEYPG